MNELKVCTGFPFVARYRWCQVSKCPTVLPDDDSWKKKGLGPNMLKEGHNLLIGNHGGKVGGPSEEMTLYNIILKYLFMSIFILLINHALNPKTFQNLIKSNVWSKL